MPRVCVAGDFSATRTASDHQRVFLGASRGANLGIQYRHAILLHQPFRNGRINKEAPKLVAMSMAEFLEGSVRYKWVDDSQTARGYPRLNLCLRDTQETGYALPREPMYFSCEGICDSSCCGGA